MIYETTLTQGEYEGLLFAAERGYDCGLLSFAAVENLENGDVLVGFEEESKAFAFDWVEEVLDGEEAFGTCMGRSLLEKVEALYDSII